jgi:hypothetical protein
VIDDADTDRIPVRKSGESHRLFVVRC